MSETHGDDKTPSHGDAGQAIAVMIGLFVFATVVWQDRSNLLLAVFSFCIFFMTFVTSTLCLIEGRVKRGASPLLKFCLPGTALLAFSSTLFLVSGFFVWAICTLAMAAALALYRRQAAQGAFGLIPAAGLDLGLVGGLGAVAATTLLVLINLAVRA